MPETRKWYDKRVINSVELLNEDDCAVICTTKGGAVVLLNYLNSVVRWRSSWYTQITPNLYYLPDDAEYEQVINFVDSITSDVVEGITMAGCKDLITINVQSANGSGCNGYIDCGSGGSGGTSPTAPPFIDEGNTNDFPEGFVDREQYLRYKCQRANALVDDIIESFNELALIEWSDFLDPTGAGPALAALLAGALALALSAPIIIALALALITYAVATVTPATVFSTIAGEINLNRDNYVCLLYLAPDAPTASDSVKNELQSWADANLSTIAAQLLPTLTSSMLAPEAFYPLFKKEPYTAPATNNCTECSGPYIVRGSGDIEGTLTSEYVAASDDYKITIVFPQGRTITGQSNSGWTNGAYPDFNGANWFFYSDVDGQNTIQARTQPFNIVFPVNGVKRVGVRSPTPFTLDWSYAS